MECWHLCFLIIPMRTTSTTALRKYVPANTLVLCLTVEGKNSSREPKTASNTGTLVLRGGGSANSVVEGKCARRSCGVYALRATSRHSYSFFEMRKRRRDTTSWRLEVGEAAGIVGRCCSSVVMVYHMHGSREARCWGYLCLCMA